MTVSVTGSVTEVGEQVEQLKVTLPVYGVVLAAKVPTVTDTASVADPLAGIVPVVEPMLSQVPPVGVVTAAVALNVCAEPLLVVTDTFCGCAVPPAVAVKVRPVGFRFNVGGGGGGGGVVTLAVTETVWAPSEALPVAGVMVTLPVQVPDGRLPAPLIPTVTDVGVLAPGGMAVSQFPQLVVEKLVVYGIAAPLLVTVIVPVVGVGVPLLTLKVSEVGLTLSVGRGGGATAGVMV